MCDRSTVTAQGAATHNTVAPRLCHGRPVTASRTDPGWFTQRYFGEANLAPSVIENYLLTTILGECVSFRV